MVDPACEALDIQIDESVGLWISYELLKLLESFMFVNRWKSLLNQCCIIRFGDEIIKSRSKLLEFILIDGGRIVCIQCREQFHCRFVGETLNFWKVVVQDYEQGNDRVLVNLVDVWSFHQLESSGEILSQSLVVSFLSIFHHEVVVLNYGTQNHIHQQEEYNDHKRNPEYTGETMIVVGRHHH